MLSYYYQFFSLYALPFFLVGFSLARESVVIYRARVLSDAYCLAQACFPSLCGIGLLPLFLLRHYALDVLIDYRNML